MNVKNLLIPVIALCSPVVLAGDLGSTSSDTTDVSVTIPPLVQLTVEGNITMSFAGAANDTTGSTGLCIYRNGTGSVNLTLSSSNEDGSGSFQMASGTERLPYSFDLSGADIIASFTHGSPAAVANPNTSSATCSGGFGHDLTATVLAADQDAAVSGAYSDTVSIVVSPI